MVDGKVLNALTETKSTHQCFLCGMRTKDFNNLNKAFTTPVIDRTRLEFGISIFHCWIRLFEFCLHIAYKLPLKTWRVSACGKQTVVETKKLIQHKFRLATGLLIDMPKQGLGNTNDGNSARKFFENPELTAEITGMKYV